MFRELSIRRLYSSKYNQRREEKSLFSESLIISQNDPYDRNKVAAVVTLYKLELPI